jgi:hypothetical protein
MWILLFTLLPSFGFGQDGTTPDRFTILPDPTFKSLDDQVQSLRKDVLTLSQDLSRLQNNLLTPAATQISVFVSLDSQESMNIEAVQLQVDDRPVANYIYTAGEQQALRHGGVQRLYMGNVAVGPHKLSASFTGKDASGNERRGTVNGKFEKSMAAKFIEIKLAKGAASTPQLILKEWE